MASKPLLFLISSFLFITTTTRVVGINGSSAEVNIPFVPYPHPPPSLPPPAVKYPPPPPFSKKPPPPPPPSFKKSPPPPLKYTPPPPPPPPTKPPTGIPPPPKRTECIPLCLERCKKNGRKNVCVRACLTCSNKCKCVPPSQYGNKEKCGSCYANWTTHGGRPKCP